MINRDENPEYINSFLDYSATILNKSPNSIKEYNYDLMMFFRFIKIHFKLTDETDFSKIKINDIPISVVQKITLSDIHAFISYMAIELRSKSATRARKVSTIRIFFKYLSQKANILKVIDHHCISDFCIKYPTYVRTEAIGCTESILYKLYKENNVEIDKKIATLMLSAIISDTLLFKSPTCTKEDIEIANELAKIAELDANTYGLDMLKAGTDLTGFSAKDILFIDAKETSLKDVKSIIAQVNTACIDDVMKFKTDLEAEMNKIIEEKDLGLFVLAITDIINNNSQAIVLGKRADIVEKSYNVTLENNTALLKGVVSRKKQMVPIMTENA